MAQIRRNVPATYYIINSPILEPQEYFATGKSTFNHGVYSYFYGSINTLSHRCDNSIRSQVALICVNSNDKFLGLLSCLDNTIAGFSCGMIYNVKAIRVQQFGDIPPLGGVAKGLRSRT